jgi:serine/threonine protein kinase
MREFSPGKTMEKTSVYEGLGREEFLQSLRDSKLLSAQDVERFETANPDADSLVLASTLVESGALTAYQMEAVCQQKATELLVGNYEILDRLGAGGMGTVFKARHRRMKRIVALKVLARNLSSDETFVKRFQREVETIAQLSHPNIVMAYDADEDAVGHFLVMEYVSGADLASLVHKQGTFDVVSAVNCILQAARGLEYAHRQGIIHRDIKPANLLRDVNGVVKVTDLGLARINNANTALGAETTDSSLTKAGGIMGTTDYMPPEQAVDATSIDHRADIYSLGATLYFLLFGSGPFTGPTMMATLLKHREAPIPVLSDLRKDVPAQLDDVFRRMLAKQATDRQRTMADVVLGLEAVLANLSGIIPQPATTPPVPQGSDSVTAKTTTGRFSPDTTFTPPERDSTLNIRPLAPETGKGPCVLLVEPSRTQAGIIRRYLQTSEVANFITAATGQEALKAVRENSPDGIVCAMHLNDMTGIQLAQQVLSETQGVPPGFVLISSESESKDIDMLIRSGQVIVLHKPFTAEAIVQALRVSSTRLNALKPPSGAALKTPSGSSNAPAPVAPPDRSKYRVLIVDDSAPARVNERNVLKGLGFSQFLEAADGAQAVAVVSTHKIDLIITDYNMPHMDGPGLVGYLKQNANTASVPIVMVTTETDPRKLEAVRQLGVVAVCDKSFPANVVKEIIERLF